MKYQSIQFGWIISLIFAIVLIILIIGYSYNLGQNPIDTTGLLIVGGILLIALLCFYQLKVVVRDKTIHLIYGIGLIRIKVKPKNIHELRMVKTPLYWGLGIRITLEGMLYNIQGTKGVKITFRDGGRKRTIRIGTPEPEALMDAIKKEFQVSV